MQPYEVPSHTSDFQTLKPYFSMLHLSPVVRSETAAIIYRTAFANRWFDLEIDSTCNDTERTKTMLSTFPTAIADMEFGLHFEVRDCGRDVFLQFVELVLDVLASDSEMWADLDDRWGYPEGGRVVKTPTPSGKVGYMHESDYKDRHQLWVFGALAKYDWSGFEFKLPSPARARGSEVSHLDASYYQRELVGDDRESASGETAEDEGEDDEDDGLDGGNEAVVSDSDDGDDGGVISSEDEDEGGKEGLLDTEDE